MFKYSLNAYHRATTAAAIMKLTIIQATTMPAISPLDSPFSAIDIMYSAQYCVILSFCWSIHNYINYSSSSCMYVYNIHVYIIYTEKPEISGLSSSVSCIARGKV